MPTYVLRVWVPDRPGALGAVASRIGAVRGDLAGIDILERGGGRAIDELVVDLPDEALVPLLLTEVGEVDGVDVEDIRPAPAALADPRLDALETAALLVEQIDIDGLLLTLATHARHDFEADWAVVIDPEPAIPLAAVGATPPTPWLAAFVSGSKSSVRVAAGECGPDDVAWASVDSADLAVVVGRRGRPFRARERRQLAALSRVASSRWSELAKVATSS
jgi:hypothetical protein